MDELIVKLADTYERKAFPELLKMILQMVQEILMYRIFHDQTGAVKCCDIGTMYFLMLGEAENGNAGTQPFKEYLNNGPKKSEHFASSFSFSGFFGMFPCLKKSRSPEPSPGLCCGNRLHHFRETPFG